MTPSFLPGLAPIDQKREKVRKRVRPTSRAQYAVARERFKGRRGNVLLWLGHHYNATATPPTSGELMAWVANVRQPDEFKGKSTDWALLYVRRGIADLQMTNSVEKVPDGERRCAYSGTKCETWRVVPR